jgi:hypothetical protein
MSRLSLVKAVARRKKPSAKRQRSAIAERIDELDADIFKTDSPLERAKLMRQMERLGKSRRRQ